MATPATKFARFTRKENVRRAGLLALGCFVSVELALAGANAAYGQDASLPGPVDESKQQQAALAKQATLDMLDGTHQGFFGKDKSDTWVEPEESPGLVEARQGDVKLTVNGESLATCQMPEGPDTLLVGEADGIRVLDDGEVLKTELETPGGGPPPDGKGRPPPPALDCADLMIDAENSLTGEQEVIVSPPVGPRTMPDVKVMNPAAHKTLAVIEPQLPERYRGTNVALTAGNLLPGEEPRVVVGTAAGEVQLFAPTGELTFRFKPFPEYEGTPRVALGNVDTDAQAELVTTPGPSKFTPAKVRVFDAASGEREHQFLAHPSDHLRFSGYFHGHDKEAGLDLPATHTFTNEVQLKDAEHLSVASRYGSSATVDLGLSDDPRTWETKIRNVRNQILRENVDTSDLKVLVRDEPELRGWDTAKQEKAVRLTKRIFSEKEELRGVQTVLSYFRDNGERTKPPPNVDIIAINAFPQPDLIGSTEGELFKEALERVDWAADFGKPVILTVTSFSIPDGPYQLWKKPPSPELVNRYLEAALADERIVGVWFFLHGKTNGVVGAREFPRLEGIHRRFGDVVEGGSGGGVVALGDFDPSTDHLEIAVGQGPAPGNDPGWRAYTRTGEPVTDANELSGDYAGLTGITTGHFPSSTSNADQFKREKQPLPADERVVLTDGSAFLAGGGP